MCSASADCFFPLLYLLIGPETDGNEIVSAGFYQGGLFIEKNTHCCAEKIV